MNKCFFLGRLVKDIELRSTNTGKSVAQFSIAVRGKKKQDGTYDAEFLNMVAWEKTAEILAQYVHKGDQISLVGEATTRSYDKDGQKHYVTEFLVRDFEFCGSKQQTPQDSSGNHYGGPSQQRPFDEDIPF